MLYHTEVVARSLSSAFLITDLPFQSTLSTDLAINSAGRMVSEGGAQMVKIEGMVCEILYLIYR